MAQKDRELATMCVCVRERERERDRERQRERQRQRRGPWIFRASIMRSLP